MLRLRKEQKDLFVYGEFAFLDWESDHFLVYQKTTGSEKVVVFINLSTEEAEPPVAVPRNAELLVNTHNPSSGAVFGAFEGRVYKL